MQGALYMYVTLRSQFECFNLVFTGLEGTLGKVGTGGGKKLSMSKINIGKGKDKKKKKR